jgi:hypothetical protein
MNTTSVILTSILTCAFCLDGGPFRQRSTKCPHYRQLRIRGPGAMCRLNIHPRPPRTNCTRASLTPSGSRWSPSPALRDHPPARCRRASEQGRRNRRLRPALAGAGQEVGRRVAGPVSPRAGRKKRTPPREPPNSGWTRALAPTNPSSRPLKRCRSNRGIPN